MCLSIDADWQRLDAGSPEDRACFALVGIKVDNSCLTEAENAFVGQIQKAVPLSAYRLAEWLAWNWWRLRWEPRSGRRDWALAHSLGTIGGGYVWPNVTVASDGERIFVLAKPTRPHPAEPLRYIAHIPAVVGAAAFEDGIDRFVDRVCDRLRAERVGETNLDHIWDAVQQERADPEASKRRILEALLGHDPDEADPALIERLIADAERLGQNAVNEIAADDGKSGTVVTADGLRKIAATHGAEARPGEAVRLSPSVGLTPIGRGPAWLRGVEAAQALRRQEQLGASSISNNRLAELAGVPAGMLAAERRRDSAPLSFALDDGPATGRVVLRSRWETGQRFELARLLGDRLAYASGERLLPATRTYTYRQKLQRSFGAELLCPFEPLEDMLAGDYSEESFETAAAHFNVSPLTVRTLLVNHRRIDRDDLEGDPEAQSLPNRAA